MTAFLSSKKKKKILACLDEFNKFNEYLKFTHELEENNSLPFLELRIMVENNSIVTEWYMNPTASGRYMNYLSHHPIEQNRAIIYS